MHYVQFFLDEAPEYETFVFDYEDGTQDLTLQTELERYLLNYWVDALEFMNNGDPKEIVCYPEEAAFAFLSDCGLSESYPVDDHGIMRTLRRYGGIAHVYIGGKVAATYTADFTRQSVACTYTNKME